MASTPCNRPRRYGSAGYVPTFRGTVPNGIKSSLVSLISNLFANYYPRPASINHRAASFVTFYDTGSEGGRGSRYFQFYRRRASRHNTPRAFCYVAFNPFVKKKTTATRLL